MHNISEINVMFHDDWEIYGDGSGDPEKLMFIPAKKILDVCDRYNGKYTFFAEIGQQLHMLNAPNRYWNKMANYWETILLDAIKRGHDVQLHFHPQWIGARLINGNWKLNVDNYNTANIDEMLLDDWIKQGKDYLEKLLNKSDKKYNVLAYRAGGWLCQPSNKIYNVLKKNGIKCDSSVIFGQLIELDNGQCVDFRNSVSKYEMWEVNPKNFAKEKSGSGLYELPVFTEKTILSPLLYLMKNSFKLIYYYEKYKKHKLIKKTYNSYENAVIIKKMKKNYCGNFGYIHYKHLAKFLYKIQKMEIGKFPKYLIYMSHSKNMLDFNNFTNLVKILNNKHDVKMVTTSKYILENIKND